MKNDYSLFIYVMITKFNLFENNDGLKYTRIYNFLNDKNYDGIIEFIKNGDFNVNDIYDTQSKETLLFYFVKHKLFKYTKEILLLDAQPNLKNKYNNTPLFYAIHNKNFKISKLLTDYGAKWIIPKKNKDYDIFNHMNNTNKELFIVEYPETYEKYTKEKLRNKYKI